MRRDQRTRHVYHVAITAIAVIMLATWSCQKATPENPNAGVQSQQADALLGPDQNVRLQYRDSLLFYKSNPRNYTVRPVRTPAVPGFFVSDPEGLKINATNGMIEVNESESGLRYKVYYMSLDNQPIDSTSITIAGIDYQDGIFEINASAEHETVVPVYKGTSTAIPCVPGDASDTSGTIQCVFDETDLDGNGTSDVGGVNREKLRVNKKTGNIDLEQSLADGVFGTLTPRNGAQRDFSIYYRLNDASQKALSKITVRLYHYTSMDKIPAWLLEELRMRKEAAAAAPTPTADGSMTQ